MDVTPQPHSLDVTPGESTPWTLSPVDQSVAADLAGCFSSNWNDAPEFALESYLDATRRRLGNILDFGTSSPSFSHSSNSRISYSATLPVNELSDNNASILSQTPQEEQEFPPGFPSRFYPYSSPHCSDGPSASVGAILTRPEEGRLPGPPVNLQRGQLFGRNLLRGSLFARPSLFNIQVQPPSRLPLPGRSVPHALLVGGSRINMEKVVSTLPDASLYELCRIWRRNSPDAAVRRVRRRPITSSKCILPAPRPPTLITKTKYFEYKISPSPGPSPSPPPNRDSSMGLSPMKLELVGSMPEVSPKLLLEGHNVYFRGVRKWIETHHIHRLARFENRLDVLFPINNFNKDGKN